MKRIFCSCLLLLGLAACDHWPWEPSTPEKAPGFPTYSGEPDKAKETAHQLISRYDRAVSRGIIPRGTADRRKSRIAKFVAKLKK